MNVTAAPEKPVAPEAPGAHEKNVALEAALLCAAVGALALFGSAGPALAVPDVQAHMLSPLEASLSVLVVCS